MNQVADIDFSKVATLGDALLAQINALREAEPVYWSERQDAWIVSRHSDVLEGFAGSLPLSVGAKLHMMTKVLPEAERDSIPATVFYGGKMLVSLDPPEQLRLRRLMMKAFGRPVVEANRAFVREHIARVLDQAAAQGEVEFVEEVARPITGRVILRWMGLDDAYYPQLRRWASVLTAAFGGGGITPQIVRECEVCVQEMRDRFQAEVDLRRAHPGDDFISALVAAEENGERLSDDDIIAACILSLIAGHDTNTSTMSLGVVAMARHPEARAWMRDHPADINDAVMEIMRYVSMSTSKDRVATADFEWHGKTIRKGDRVFLLIAGANRDPRVFENPERFDPSRNQFNNMTFAPGLHHCIGHLLAKMQVTEFFGALVNRFDEIEVLEPPEWATPLGFRGLHRLPLRLTPRRA